MPSKPLRPVRSLRLGTKLIRITNLYDITVKQVHTYVRGLHHRIRQQAKTIRKLRRKVAALKKQRKVKSAPSEQVPEGEDGGDDDVMKALEKAEQEAKAAEPLDVKAFVDDIKKTAQDFDYQNRYIYEPTSGMYYDPETGYYYNAIYGLHYDGQRGCYLKYNEQTGEYDFYSQVMPEEQLEEKKPKARQKSKQSKAAAVRTKDEESDRRRRHRSRSPRRRRSRHRRSSSRSTSPSSSSGSSEEEERRRKRRKKDRKVKRKKDKKDRGKRKKEKQESEAEEGELEESSNSSGSESGKSFVERNRVIVLDSSSDGGVSDGDEEVATFGANYPDISRKYPPSLRIIVQETNVATLRKGSLFIVTCKGGSLGREGDHDVIIPDINVSKYHLKFTYDQKKATYRVLDLGSRNGTLLNGVRMAPTMQESDPFPLTHGDVLELNQTRLLCHVHDGAITCAKCEPGLLMRGDEIGSGLAGGEDGAEKIVNPVSHKEGLKMLQKRYGLEEEKYVDPPPQPASSSTGDYTDRAAHRRKTKGSTNEHAKAQVASVDQHIPAENKGFRMLAKLGWSEGQTLGKNDGDGLREPIPMVANVGTSGLGCQGGMTQSAAASTVDERKKAIWMRTQERYQACADVVEEKATEQDRTEKASLSQQISSGNRGFQMLAKLGWNEGETLGKNEDGLKEPIGLLTNVGTSGLGSKPLKKPGGEQSVSGGGGREKTIWKKKQEKRKPVVQHVNLFEASDSE